MITLNRWLFIADMIDDSRKLINFSLAILFYHVVLSYCWSFVICANSADMSPSHEKYNEELDNFFDHDQAMCHNPVIFLLFEGRLSLQSIIYRWSSSSSKLLLFEP